MRGERTEASGTRQMLKFWPVAAAFGVLLMAGQPAFAACTPQSASNITATCTGITNNQGGGAPGSSGDIARGRADRVERKTLRNQRVYA